MQLLAVPLACLIVVAVAGGRAAEQPNRSPEFQVLERFLGQWETVVTVKPTGEKLTSTQSRRWSKGGKFILSEEQELSTKKESHFLLTYDPSAKVYRSCFINEGHAVVILGTWDNDARTMKWQARDASGVKHDGVSRFIDKDHVEWTMVVTAPDGKVLIEMSAKQTRQKDSGKRP